MEETKRIYAMREAMTGMKTLWKNNKDYLPGLQLRFEPSVPPNFFFSRLKLLKDGVRFTEGAVE